MSSNETICVEIKWKLWVQRSLKESGTNWLWLLKSSTSQEKYFDFLEIKILKIYSTTPVEIPHNQIQNLSPQKVNKQIIYFRTLQCNTDTPVRKADVFCLHIYCVHFCEPG